MASKTRKRRGLVLTGGGAKGLYEAGVIHAFHITGMDFDVLTGSSIGAMNAIVYAEYLRRKRRLPAEVRADTEKATAALDSFVRAFHYAWLRMEHLNLIDDSDAGALGRLKDDLGHSGLDLPLAVRLAWWWTTPADRRPGLPWKDLARLARELVERIGLGGAVSVLRQAMAGGSVGQALLTAYLERLGWQKALIPPKSPAENAIRDTFTRNELVLQPHHLEPNYRPQADEGGERVPLLDPNLTMGDYLSQGIEVRLTRANYRTGRLESSAHCSPESFVAYLQNQAWRLETAQQQTPPLGSHRLQVPGNPSAIGAALASGRFPGVFAPYPIDQIYDLDRPENDLLKRFLEGWLEDAEVETRLRDAFQRRPGAVADPEAWQRLYQGWRGGARLREFFPRAGDFYVDGGAIDNTPSNGAVDAVREWIEREGLSKREVQLDLYVVFLHAEPVISPAEARNPALHEVVGRTLNIVSAANLSSDAAVVETINTFGRRAEALGEALQGLLEAVTPLLADLEPEARAGVESRLREFARERDLRGYRGSEAEGILGRLETWTNDAIRRGLPLEVQEIKIYPDVMALDTLQFTQRLGYRKEAAIQMLTMGCYNTLWAVRSTLEERSEALDAQDEVVLAQARRWMGGGDWPATPPERQALRASWRCQRRECIYHRTYCPRGEQLGQ